MNKEEDVDDVRPVAPVVLEASVVACVDPKLNVFVDVAGARLLF